MVKRPGKEPFPTRAPSDLIVTNTTQAYDLALPSAGVRALELERRPHVRLMLSRCERRLREVDEEALSREMTKSNITIWLSRLINDPTIPTRQRLSAARQLSVMNGWIGEKNQHQDERSIFAGIMARAQVCQIEGLKMVVETLSTTILFR
jgi:hypothetical protein